MECIKNPKKDCWRMLLDETPACLDDNNCWCSYHTDVVQFRKDWGKDYRRESTKDFDDFREGARKLREKKII